MSLAELARFIAAEPEFDTRWRLVVEFLKEYHQEPEGTRQRLLANAPGSTGASRAAALLVPVRQTRRARSGAGACPAAFRGRGVFVADYQIDAVLAACRRQRRRIHASAVLPDPEIRAYGTLIVEDRRIAE